MTRVFLATLLLALAGCATLPRPELHASPCATSEASYACQVERYNNVSVP